MPVWIEMIANTGTIDPAFRRRVNAREGKNYSRRCVFGQFRAKRDSCAVQIAALDGFWTTRDQAPAIAGRLPTERPEQIMARPEI